MPAQVAVDPADQPVDLVAEAAGSARPSSRDGVATWTNTASSTSSCRRASSSRERAQPGVDALGVVEPVDAEDHLRGLPSASRMSTAPLLDCRGAGQPLEAPTSMRDREGRRAHRRARPGRYDQVTVASCGRPAGGPGARSSAPRRRSWKPTRSAPSSPSRICRRHGSCWNSSAGGNGMCRKKPIRRSGPQLAQHLRHELELVVVHPHGRVLGGHLAACSAKRSVDRDVGLPPLPVELRLGDDVVVQRPERGVREALVELLDLLGAQRHRDELEALVLERLEVGLGAARPADPDAVVGPHHRLDRGDQAAGRAPPVDAAVRLR